MTKKIWVYMAGGIIVILFLFSLLISSKTPTPSQTATTTPDQTVIIPTNNGQVTVKDITKNPIQQVSDTIVFERTNQFSIIFYPNEKTFSINLLSQPLETSRQAAESALLKDLGVDMAQACKLTVSTFIPYDVDQNLSGQDYGLSFCPGGKGF